MYFILLARRVNIKGSYYCFGYKYFMFLFCLMHETCYNCAQFCVAASYYRYPFKFSVLMWKQTHWTIVAELWAVARLSVIRGILTLTLWDERCWCVQQSCPSGSLVTTRCKLSQSRDIYLNKVGDSQSWPLPSRRVELVLARTGTWTVTWSTADTRHSRSGCSGQF